MQLQLRFYWYVLINNLTIAYSNSILYMLIEDLKHLLLKYYSPYKHQRLSKLMGYPVFTNSAYFKCLYLSRFESNIQKFILENRI